MKLFLESDSNLILFVCYGGKKFEDSPREIFEEMKKDSRFSSYQYIWAFADPNKFKIEGCRIIKINSLEYFKVAIKARVWITNVDVKRGLSFSGIKTLSINTWHGTAVKKIGADADSTSTFKTRDNGPLADIMLAQSQYDVEVYSKAFKLSKENVVITGFPRNDSLVRNNSNEKIIQIKNNLNLPLDKKIILYAPTYRDYDRKTAYNIYFLPPIDLNRWKQELGDHYVLLIRAHMAVVDVLGVEENEFVRNFSLYPELNDILLVSDILISDYSGILFDYSILERPILCYSYDYDIYKKTRGMYIDIREDLIAVDKEDELVDSILNMDVEKMCRSVKKFKDKYVAVYGNSSKRVLDVICEKL